MCRLVSVIQGLSNGNTADYLRQLTDVYRLHLFDIVMQYRAIFSVVDTAGETVSTSASHDTVLFSWAQSRIQFFCEPLELRLPSCAPMSAGHAQYFARELLAIHCFQVLKGVGM